MHHHLCAQVYDRRKRNFSKMSANVISPFMALATILRGTRNLSFVLRRSLLRTFETIWILVIILECSNITASKSIRRERKMRPTELSGVNFSTHGSESECSCFDQSHVSVCDELQSHNLCDLCLQYATAQCGLVTDNVRYRIAHSSVCRRLQINVIYVAVRFITIACRKDTYHKIVK